MQKDKRLVDCTLEDLEEFFAPIILKTQKQDEFSSKKKKEEEFIEIEEACTVLHLSKPSIYRKVSKREINSYKSGHRLLFKREELFQWISTNKKPKKIFSNNKINKK